MQLPIHTTITIHNYYNRCCQWYKKGDMTLLQRWHHIARPCRKLVLLNTTFFKRQMCNNDHLLCGIHFSLNTNGHLRLVTKYARTSDIFLKNVYHPNLSLMFLQKYNKNLMKWKEISHQYIKFFCGVVEVTWGSIGLFWYFLLVELN